MGRIWRWLRDKTGGDTSTCDVCGESADYAPRLCSRECEQEWVSRAAY